MGVGFSPWKTTPARPVPQVSPDTVLHLLLRDSHEGHRGLRSYSLEELKELMNKLMLMSGKKDHNSAGVEEFSEVGPASSQLWGLAPQSGVGDSLPSIPKTVGRVWV